MKKRLMILGWILFAPLVLLVFTSCSKDKDSEDFILPDQPTNIVPETEPETKIPVVTIETENHTRIQDKANYVNCTVKISDEDKTYTDGSTFSAPGRIRGRGNSTWDMP